MKCSISTIALKGALIGALQTAGGAQVPLNTPEKEINPVFEESELGMRKLKEFLMSGGGLITQHLTSTILGEEHESAENSKDTLDGFTNSAGGVTEIELVEP